MAPNISYSYRVEAARKKIASGRTAAATAAKEFDFNLAQLGKKELTPQEYRGLVVALLRQLDQVEQLLQGVLEAARPFPRDLVMEIQWAEADLRRIQDTKQELTAELHASS